MRCFAPASSGARSTVLATRTVHLAPCVPKVAPQRSVCVRSTAEPSVQSLQAEMEALRRENERLKTELAAAQGMLVAPPAPAPEVPAPVAQAQHQAPQGSGTGALRDGIAWPTAGETFWSRPARSAPLPAELAAAIRASQASLQIEKDGRPLHIAHITAEMAPIAKVGGLGDVVTGLARSCMARGHHVTVMMPFYECLPKDQIEGLKHEMDLDVPKGHGTLRTSVFWGKIAGVPTYLIRPADWNACNIFRGGRIYGGSYNEMEAYLYLNRASLEFLKASGQQPHILQVHDWHAAAAPMLYWQCFHEQGLWRPRVVLTIHNLENTGECRQDDFLHSGEPGESFAQVERALDERTIGHNPERLNMMKGGLVYSNAVTTVSPTYAREIKEAGAAGWMKHVFARDDVAAKFKGILNGIDFEEWDPASDALLAANYSAEKPEGKALCKEFLQRGLGLTLDPSKPLVAVISRLVPQKGIGLIHAAVGRTVEKGGQFVLLGSGHSDGVFKHMAAGPYKDHPNCSIKVMYSEQLAHMIYAAADIVLVPSMFEPCGLTQMIAMRYGAIPLVRRTGGLADTVQDVDSGQGQGNGYAFDGANEGALYGALDRALQHYTEQPSKWRELSLSNMKRDVSWAQSAKSYVELYNSIAAPN